MNNLDISDDHFAGQFIRRCLEARRRPESLYAARVLAAEPQLDWSQVLAVSTRNRVSELLYDAVRGRDLVPESVERALGKALERNFCRNLFLLHEMGLITQELAALGLDVLVLKGAALATTVYQNIGLRPMVDIDLLVRREETPDIVKALTMCGFEKKPEPRPGAALAHENELALQRPGLETLNIDLHWSLFDSIFYQQHLDLEWFWQTSLAREYGQAPLCVLGPEAQLIHLCGHLALHHSDYPNLLWLNDLVEIVETFREELDWEVLVSKSRSMALIIPVRTYLTLIAEDWQAPIPPRAIESMHEQQVSPLEQRSYELHTSKRHESLTSRVLPDILELPSGGKRLQFLLDKLVPTPDYMRMRYQPARDVYLPFIYVYHLVVGVITGTLVLAQIVLKGHARQLYSRRDGSPSGQESGEGRT